jgi:cell division protein DivIC
MKKLKQLWFSVLPLFKNKYTLTLILFFTWISFFDQNNLLDRVSNLKQLHQLERDQIYFKDKIIKDSDRLKELKSNSDNLEKFAREQYLMKKSNEDIYIVVDN